MAANAPKNTSAPGEGVQSVYLVTGSSKGIGLEFVMQILQEKQTVVIACARAPEKAQGLQELAQQKDLASRLHLVSLDVVNEQSVKAAAQWVQQHVGRLDVLINNAGAMEKELKRWTDVDVAEAESILRTNVVGPLLVSAAMLPIMRNSPGGRKLIAHMSSSMGSFADTLSNLAAKRQQDAAAKDQSGTGGPAPLTFHSAYPTYRASKAAVDMEMLVMAADLEPEGFTVVSLHPGWVDTDMGTTGFREFMRVSKPGKQVPVEAKAPVTPQDSVRGLLSVLHKLQPQDTGTFWSYEGKQMQF